MSEWQPIETAPEDGAMVLVVCEYAGEPFADIASFSRLDGRGQWVRMNRYICKPTHWMPIPPLPEKSS